MQELRIGQVAAQTKLTTETIRYYEKEALITPPRRDGNGYRAYPTSVISRLQYIRRAKNLGFSLNEIRDLLQIFDDKDGEAGAVRQHAQAKLEQIEQSIRALTDIKNTLKALTQACPGSGHKINCPIFNVLAAP